MKNSILFFALLLLSCSKEEPAIIPEKEMEEVMDEQQKDIAEVDAMVASFIQKYDIPGAYLAVAKQEKLVYTKPYGMANKERNEAVTNESIFRIASCTKLYTAIAILKLIEEGKFKLDDPVFGEGAVLGTKYGSKPYSESLKKVTVRNLLNQTSGHFINSQGQDLMHFRYDLDSDDYLSWLVDNHVQEFDPGMSYRYLNSNYFIASKIVEQVSGERYIDFLTENVLKPIGDNTTKLAVNGTLLPNEVTAYSQGSLVGSEYNVSYERNFGSGGLVGNARTLVKLITSIDSRTLRPEILPMNLYNDLIKPSSANENFALGISVFPQYFSFSGALPGTRSMWFYNRDTGVAVALVLNGFIDSTDRDLFNQFTSEMQNVLASIMNGNIQFQDIDQF